MGKLIVKRKEFMSVFSEYYEKTLSQNSGDAKLAEKEMLGLIRSAMVGVERRVVDKALIEPTKIERKPKKPLEKNKEQKESQQEKREWISEQNPPLPHFPSVVLISPQIPPNTGTIARLCAAWRCPLHLVEPMGFELSEKSVRRAGLDYWPHVNLKIHKSWESFLEEQSPERLLFVETGEGKSPFQISFSKDDYLVFGAETFGIPQKIMDETKGTLITLPMFSPHVRSLNLANVVAIILYTAIESIKDHDL